MSRRPSAPAAVAGVATLATLAAVLVPTSSAGAATACVAWGTLPARVTLGPAGATVHSTLHATAACTGVTADNGAAASLRGPGGSDEPMRWVQLGATDQATYYPTLDRPGTYRLVDGRVQTYDSAYRHIPASWSPTATVVKYEGRFVAISHRHGRITATLQSYGRLGW